MATNIDGCVREILDNGHCILPDQFPRPLLEQCNKDFQPILEDISRRIPDGNRGTHRWANGLAFGPPFYHSEFFNNDTVIKITSRILGEGMHISAFGMDTPIKGSEYQGIHADIPFMFPEDPNLQHPPVTLSVRFTFVDMTADNGPFSVAPGSHHLPRAETIAKAKSGEIELEPIYLKTGDVLISDARAIHRGTPNLSDAPRPFAVIVYNRSYYFTDGHAKLEAREDIPRLTNSFYQTLSQREQDLLRMIPRTTD